MSFVSLVEKTLSNATETENGAPSNKSTLSKVLDYFSKCSALRNQKDKAIELFDAAYTEDRLLTLKTLFYSRDIRGGQGEREIFRNIIKHLAETHHQDIIVNIENIEKYGRWDDYYSLVGTEIENAVFDFLHFKLQEDISNHAEHKPISLLAKWLKSENTSSPESQRLAKITRKHFGMTSKDYRLLLSSLRKHIDVVERKMSSKTWSEIEYSKVPSKAMTLHAKAFGKHDKERYATYLQNIAEGKEKINSGTLYPYDIVRKYLYDEKMTPEEDKAYELQWNNLPNYFKDGEYNTLTIVDTSGSMYSYGEKTISPIDVAVSLGLYMAEKNKGILNGYFMTFSNEPQMVKIKGDTLKEKISSIKRANWGMNTDLLKVFSVLLKTIRANKIPPEEVPKKLFIISDMQFDDATSCGRTTFEEIDAMYEKYKIQRPELVFWNVRAASDIPVLKDDNGTFLVSGASPSILSHALNTEAQTPYEFMLEVLNDERYSSVV